MVVFNADEEVADQIYTTAIKDETVFYPAPESNSLSMEMLLMENGITTDYIIENGALLEIIFRYNCDLKYSFCEPIMEFSMLSDDTEPPIYIEDSNTY